MAVTYDNKAINQGSGASFTVGSNSNRILLISVVNNTPGTPVTAVSYAGAALTNLFDSSTSDSQTWVGYKLAPATGSNTVTVTGGGGLNVQIYSYYNVYQATPVASNMKSGTGTSLSNAINTVADNAVLWATFGSGQAGVASTITYSTNLANNRAPNAGTDVNGSAMNASADSGAITPAASTTQTMTLSNAPTNGWRFVQIALAPDTYSPVNSGAGFFNFM